MYRTRISSLAVRAAPRKNTLFRRCVRYLATEPSTTAKPTNASATRNNPFPAPTGPDSLAFPATKAFENEHSVTGEADDLAADLRYQNLTQSHMGLAHEPFPKHVTDILLRDIPKEDIEVKPDGILYLPEIKYRRILNEAFGPGGWGLIPRGPHTISMKTISREYALFCDGRFISQARGEQTYFSEDGLATATEGCKSNALMRCCKDLGIASELWDPVFVQEFKAKEAVQKMTVNTFNGTRKLLWRRKDRKFAYPIAEDDGPGGAPKSNGFGNQSAGAGAKTWVKKT